LSLGIHLDCRAAILARCQLIDVKRADINLKRLTEAQTAGRDGIFAHVMSAWLQWLAKSPAAWTAFGEAREERRGKSGHQDAHARTGRNEAELLAALDVYFDFAKEVGAISDAERQKFVTDCEQAIKEVGGKQAEHYRAEQPSTRFLEIIRAALDTKRARLELLNTEDKEVSCYSEPGEMLGWRDAHMAYLQPDAAYQFAQRQAQGENRPLGVSGPRVLWARMAEAGLIALSDEGRNTLSKKIAGVNKKVLAIALSRLTGDVE
jgi:hypothetical protein